MTKQKQRTMKNFDKEVLKEISRIEIEEGLTAEAVIKNAKNKKNPLHNLFDWNDDSAGRKFRIYQATKLICEVKILVEDKVLRKYGNVSIVTEDGSRERVFKSQVEILSNKEFKRQVMQRALQQQQYWTEQYQQYAEFKPIVSAIKKTKKLLDKKWQQKKQ